MHNVFAHIMSVCIRIFSIYMILARNVIVCLRSMYATMSTIQNKMQCSNLHITNTETLFVLRFIFSHVGCLILNVVWGTLLILGKITSSCFIFTSIFCLYIFWAIFDFWMVNIDNKIQQYCRKQISNVAINHISKLKFLITMYIQKSYSLNTIKLFDIL